MPGSAVIDLRNSFGAAFVGLFFSSILVGLAIVQTWVYYWRYWNRDKKALKFFIGFLLVMDILDTITSAYALYWYLVLNFGNIENLGYNVWALNAQVIFSAIPGSAVQLYYARRVYLVSNSIICPVLITVLVLGGNSLGFYFTAKEVATPRFSELRTPPWLRCLGIGSAVLADIMIATMMCWSLYRKKTGFARTDSVINTLMTYSMNSGLLTSALGTAMLICFIITPNSMIWIAFFWVMCKCYLNSLLAMLNSRDHLRDRSTTNNAFSSNRFGPSFGPTIGSKSRHPTVSVSVQRSTTSDFVRSKSDCNSHNTRPTRPTLEVPKEV